LKKYILLLVLINLSIILFAQNNGINVTIPEGNFFYHNHNKPNKQFGFLGFNIEIRIGITEETSICVKTGIITDFFLPIIGAFDPVYALKPDYSGSVNFYNTFFFAVNYQYNFPDIIYLNSGIHFSYSIFENKTWENGKISENNSYKQKYIGLGPFLGINSDFNNLLLLGFQYLPQIIQLNRKPTYTHTAFFDIGMNFTF
jgi:hypothetical protein